MKPLSHTDAAHLPPPIAAVQTAALTLLLAEVTALCALMQGRLPAFAGPRGAPSQTEDRFDNMPV